VKKKKPHRGKKVYGTGLLRGGSAGEEFAKGVGIKNEFPESGQKFFAHIPLWGGRSQGVRTSPQARASSGKPRSGRQPPWGKNSRGLAAKKHCRLVRKGKKRGSQRAALHAIQEGIVQVYAQNKKVRIVRKKLFAREERRKRDQLSDLAC